MKKGIRTTELWLTVILIIAQLLAVLAGELPPNIAAVCSTASVLIYTAARSWVKAVTANNADVLLPPED